MIARLPKNPTPFPIQTTPDNSLPWRTLVRGYLSDTPRKTISDALQWGNEGLLCLALDSTTATFIPFPDHTDKPTFVVTQNHVIFITDGPYPVWPGLFDISSISKTLWPIIGTMSNEPSFDISKTLLSPLLDVTAITQPARWLTPSLPMRNTCCDRLITGLATLLSLETQKTGTFGIISRQWKADGTTTKLGAWIILEGENVETPALTKDINTLFDAIDIPIECQTSLSFDQIQRYSRIGIGNPKRITLDHKTSKHDHFALLDETQRLLKDHRIGPISKWFTP